jgi:ribosomal protein S27E
MKELCQSLKNDKYRSARGGYSRLLNVFCRKCNNLILTYQKDGPGNLRRLYIDRIFYPKNFSYLQDKNNVPVLKCKKCSEILGTPIIYKKENRKAFRLYQDAVTKKIRKIV